MKDFEYNPITNELDLVGGGGGGVERLIVNISHTPGQGEAADKTYAEIETAINAGKIVTVRNLASEYVYSHTVDGAAGTPGRHYFYVLHHEEIHYLNILSDETVETNTQAYSLRADAMPEASAAQLGNIYQYTGATISEYKHGYFYECTESGGVYYWQRVNVQPSGGGGGAAVWGEIGGDIADQTDLNTAFIRKSSLIPDSLEVSAPRRLTLGNLSHHFITPVLTPEGVAKNVIFQSDNNAVMVEPDGRIVILKKGISRVHVIPTLNTGLYKTVVIEVTEPTARFINTRTRLRFTASGAFRFN